MQATFTCGNTFTKQINIASSHGMFKVGFRLKHYFSIFPEAPIGRLECHANKHSAGKRVTHMSL